MEDMISLAVTLLRSADMKRLGNKWPSFFFVWFAPLPNHDEMQVHLCGDGRV